MEIYKQRREHTIRDVNKPKYRFEIHIKNKGSVHKYTYT